MHPGWLIRDADIDDAGACAALYAPYVTDTAITFELEPPSAQDMAGRIAAAVQTHAWVVLTDGNGLLGYAYAHRFAERAAYRWACETSVYLQTGLRRRGAGRVLYGELFARLAGRGFRRAVAGMTLAQRRECGTAPGGWLRAGRDVPQDRLEARFVARRGVDAEGPRPGVRPARRTALRTPWLSNGPRPNLTR